MSDAMPQRAYSFLTVKALDEDRRIVTGLATTPTVDRMGDSVSSEGASFNLPIPFLWQHDAHAPVGSVTKAKVTSAGIEVEVQLQRTDEPGLVKDRLDSAWHDIKLGLVRGLSIGFKPLEAEPIKGTSGLKFLKWLWFELSAVTVAANGQCSIQTIKSADTLVRRQAGVLDVVPQTTRPIALPTPPGVTGPTSPSTRKGSQAMPRTLAEQITSLEAARAAKCARMEGVMQKSMDEGRSTDAAEREEFDTLEQEVEALDGDLKRLRTMEKAAAARAVPVPEVKNAHDAARTFATAVKAPPAAPPGIRFARVVKCLGLAQGNRREAYEIAKGAYGDDDGVVGVLKAAVAAGSTSNAGWAGNLVGLETSVYADFVEFLRPQTIVGRFGVDGIPALRTVPFRTPLIGQTSGGSGYWVGEGQPKPLTSFDFARTTLEESKVANIAVVTMEVLRRSTPAAEGIIRDQLAAALRERMDIDFVNPAKAAVAGVSPASITNGAAAVASSGNDADAIRYDVRRLYASFIAANNAPTTGVFIMSTTNALAASMLVNALGQPEFAGLTMRGGTFFGLPVITSEYAGNTVTLANADDIYLGDEGGITIDMSREASLQMDNAPTGPNSVTPTGTTLVSLWQTNSVGFLAEREIGWSRRRNGSVAYLTSVNWGDPAPTTP